MRVRTEPVPLNRADVSVRTERDHFTSSWVNSYGSYNNTAQEPYKTYVSLYGDAGSRGHPRQRGLFSQSGVVRIG